MGDWAAFQEDFWKVLSTLGINQDTDANPEAAAPIPENDDKEAEWAQRGVWDSRPPHPVPSYPVMDTSICSNDSPLL